MTVDECLAKNPNAAKLLSTEHMKLGPNRRFAQASQDDDPHYITSTGSYFIPRSFTPDEIKDRFQSERARVLCQMAEGLEGIFQNTAGPNGNVEEWDLVVDPHGWLSETSIEVPNGINMFVEMQFALVKRPVSATEAA